MAVRRTRAIALAFALLLAAQATTASAAQWTPQRPHRAAVNPQVAFENARIHAERRAGMIGPAKVTMLHRPDRGIRTPDGAMVQGRPRRIGLIARAALNSPANDLNQPPRR